MSLSSLPVRAHLWYAGHGPRQLAFLLARIHPSVEGLDQLHDCWRLKTKQETYYLSDPRQITRFIGVGAAVRGRVLQKYSLPGFVEVERGDTIVDVGAFIGEFARPAGEIGDRVVAVEPDERNAAALRRNLDHLSDSDVVQKAAWNATGEHAFQVAGDPSEGSILSVDTGNVTDVVTLETTRIDDLTSDVGLDGIDFLKVEAEGAEPEVLEGLGELDTGKIAVECAPERDGETPVDSVQKWLLERGYETRSSDHIVFGRRER